MNLKKLFLLFLDKRELKNIEILSLKNIKSILIRPLGGAIGDAVVHTAHLKQLRYLYPNARIGVIVNPHNRVIFEHSNLVDEYLDRSLCCYISHYRKWDLLLDFENNFNSSSLFMDRILNPKYIAIFRKYNKKHYNFDTVKNYDFYFPQKDNERLSYYLINSSFNQNNNLPLAYSHLNVSQESINKISKYWKEDKIRLLLCPQGSKRQIPEKELAELLSNTIDKNLANKLDIILSYTNTAEKYHSNLMRLCPHLNIKLSPKTTLSEYLSLISSADLVIAVDGGSLHIACAFKKPLLSFFAKSQPNVGTWEPLVYPDVPHLKVLTYDDVGSNSNLTKNFDMTTAYEWLKKQLENRVGN